MIAGPKIAPPVMESAEHPAVAAGEMLSVCDIPVHQAVLAEKMSRINSRSDWLLFIELAPDRALIDKHFSSILQREQIALAERYQGRADEFTVLVEKAFDKALRGWDPAKRTVDDQLEGLQRYLSRSLPGRVIDGLRSFKHTYPAEERYLDLLTEAHENVRQREGREPTVDDPAVRAEFSGLVRAKIENGQSPSRAIKNPYVLSDAGFGAVVGEHRAKYPRSIFTPDRADSKASISELADRFVGHSRDGLAQEVEDRDFIETHLRRLPPKTGNYLRERYLLGKEGTEIAEEAHVTKGLVSRELKEARRMFYLSTQLADRYHTTDWRKVTEELPSEQRVVLEGLFGDGLSFEEFQRSTGKRIALKTILENAAKILGIE